jgi:hypothetical protein
LFPQAFSNIAIVAKKRSGKTNVIYNILKHCSGRDTKVMIFASTVDKDQTYKNIIKMLGKKNVSVMTETHFITDEGINLIDQLLHMLQEEARIEQAMLQEKHTAHLVDFGSTAAEFRKQPSDSATAPDYILVFDDLSADLRDKAVARLLKVNRHHRMKVILSSQSLTDLHPQAIKQLDYAMIFRSFNPDKLLKLYEHVDLSIEYSDFVRLYEHATREKWHFLYIDVRDEQFRRNFNEQLRVK